MMTKDELLLFLKAQMNGSSFDFHEKYLDIRDFNQIRDSIQGDFNRYYSSEFELDKIKYFRGLLATLFYRISRNLFLEKNEELAQELSGFSFLYTGIELFYSAEIGQNFRINHGTGTVVGARSKIGNNALLHQNVTIGEKNGRPTLGNNVIVYPGAVIVGPIKIGDDCIIGANTFLDKSIPKGTVLK